MATHHYQPQIPFRPLARRPRRRCGNLPVTCYRLSFTVVKTRVPAVMVPGGGQKLDEWLIARTLVRTAVAAAGHRGRGGRVVGRDPTRAGPCGVLRQLARLPSIRDIFCSLKVVSKD